MVRPSFPANLREFQRQFATEEACQQYLAACRWPDGFRCPRCGHERAYAMVKQGRWRCVACRYQVSLTAGTILHNTKTPLTVWFWAAYLMTTDKRGISALLLQRQLGASPVRNRLAFQTLLGLGTGHAPTPYLKIRGARDAAVRIA